MNLIVFIISFIIFLNFKLRLLPRSYSFCDINFTFVLLFLTLILFAEMSRLKSSYVMKLCFWVFLYRKVSLMYLPY